MSSNMFVLFVVYSGHFFSASSNPLLLRGAPNYSTDTVSEFHAEAHMCIYGGNCPSSGGSCPGGSCPGGEMSGGELSGGRCPFPVAAKAGVEPTTLRLKVIVSTNAPPRP